MLYMDNQLHLAVRQRFRQRREEIHEMRVHAVPARRAEDDSDHAALARGEALGTTDACGTRAESAPATKKAGTRQSSTWAAKYDTRLPIPLCRITTRKSMSAFEPSKQGGRAAWFIGTPN